VTRPLALVVAAALALAVAVGADSARACTCADEDERDRLENGEIAVLGTVLERRERHSQELSLTGEPLAAAYDYRLRVRRGAGARFGAHATVRVPEDGCGPGPAEVGDRLAAFVRRRSYGWLSSGCNVVDPAELERALRPYPRALGRGRLALLAGGSFGTARTLALTARGRILGYGFGEGEVSQISVCPGGGRAAELVEDGRRLLVAVRDLRSLRLDWTAALPMRSPEVYPGGASVRCADSAATVVHAAALENLRHSRDDPTRIFSVSAGGARQIASVARGYGAVLGPEAAYLTRSRRLIAVELDDGRLRRLARLRFADVMAISPDGRWLAFHDGERLRLLDPVRGEQRSTRIRYGGAIGWLAPDRLLFRRGGEARVYDTELTLHRRYPFYRLLFEEHLGGRLFGLDRFRLRSLDLATGRRRTLADLPDRGIADLVAVPELPLVEAKRRAPGLGFPRAASAGASCAAG
jgi:hypothetical protein